MSEAGILPHDDRVELIEGALIAMPAIGTPHAGTVNILNRLLVTQVGDRAIVSVQNPIRLDDHSEPQPDITLLRPRPDGYRRRMPRPDDVLLLIEVSDSSLPYDRSVKLPLYARHGIAEYWIVDLDGEAVEVRSKPAGDSYVSFDRHGADQIIAPANPAGVAIAVGALFG